jgi:NAD(P)-dependent dehydrogenase (short-subunit alcohol dehydrogenase family)
MPSDSAKLARPGRLSGIAYPPSKTALNMTTVQYAKAFPAMRINAVAPVFTKTALNAGIGRQSVDQGARIIARMT